MPAKNRIKIYAPNSIYHLYNRGVEKRRIFMDQQDIGVCQSYLKTYLLSKDEKRLKDIIADPHAAPHEKDEAARLLDLNNFHGELEMIAYAVMPNHFHFLVYQTAPDTIDRFMNSWATRYALYFNKRYQRVGPLFQGLYKGVLVETDPQFLYLTRYIHRNFLSLSPELREQFPSSYPVYLKQLKQEWVKPDRVLLNFSDSGYDSYRDFVETEDADENVKEAVTISKLALDLDQ